MTISTSTSREADSIVADGHRLIRMSAVLDITGLSRSTLYRLERTGSFPSAIRLSPRVRAHRLEEVVAWLDQRATSHRRVQDVRDGEAN